MSSRKVVKRKNLSKKYRRFLNRQFPVIVRALTLTLVYALLFIVLVKASSKITSKEEVLNENLNYSDDMLKNETTNHNQSRTFLDNRGLPCAGISLYLSELYMTDFEFVTETNILSYNFSEPDEIDINETDFEKSIDILIDEIVEERIYEFNIEGYSTADVNIREEPNTESDIIGMLYFNNHLYYDNYDDEWAIIQYRDNVAYVNKNYISDSKSNNYEEKSVTNDKRKSFMSYLAITNKSSNQYKLECAAYTDVDTGIRAYRGRYLIALGSGYSHTIGQYVDLVLENGVIIPCIVGDAKSNKDTDESNKIGNDGSVSEFIIDREYISDSVKLSGDISDAKDGWNSPIASINLYNKSLY